MKRINYQIGGLNVVLLKTEKFKTTDILLSFRNRLTRDTAAFRALIPHILKAGTKEFPSKSAINKELQRLFGASFGSNVNKQGLQQLVSYKMSLVNDNYLIHSDQVLDDAFKLIHEIIFNPLTEDNGFNPKIVQTEKRLLSDYFESLYDNKIRYAYDQLLAHMFKDENYQIRSIGQKEDIEKMNPQNLYQTYLDMMKQDTVELFILGDVDEERVKQLIEKYLPFEERNGVLDIVDLQEKEIRDVTEVVEAQEVSQGKLNLGFRTYTRGTDPDYYPMLITNGILGAYPHSLLFRNVREKHSLCYYISSTIDKAKGAMFIYAGVEPSDYQKALDITLQQIEDLKNGKFDEELLENTKNALVNDLLEMNDSPSSLLAADFSSLLYGEVHEVEKKIERILKVSYEDIMKAANKIKLDTVFFLTNEEVKINEKN